jgi:Phosphate transporter family
LDELVFAQGGETAMLVQKVVAPGSGAVSWTVVDETFEPVKHTISGSIVGVGASRRLSSVRWGVVGKILVAWAFTLPAAALVGALMEQATRLPAGTAVVTILAVILSAVAFGAQARSRRPAEIAARGGH